MPIMPFAFSLDDDDDLLALFDMPTYMLDDLQLYADDSQGLLEIPYLDESCGIIPSSE